MQENFMKQFKEIVYEAGKLFYLQNPFLSKNKKMVSQIL